jgi:hypothetical protein
MESILGPLGTAAITGLLYLLRVIVMMENLVEWTVLGGETEVLGENLPWRHFVYHKFHLPDLGANPGRRGGKPATNRFSYGAAEYRVTSRFNSLVDKLANIPFDYLYVGDKICTMLCETPLVTVEFKRATQSATAAEFNRISNYNWNSNFVCLCMPEEI